MANRLEKAAADRHQAELVRRNTDLTLEVARRETELRLEAARCKTTETELKSKLSSSKIKKGWHSMGLGEGRGQQFLLVTAVRDRVTNHRLHLNDEHTAEVALAAASSFYDTVNFICVVSANTATFISICQQILVNFHGSYHPNVLHTPCVVPSTYL